MARNRPSRSRRNKRYSEIDFRLPEALLRLDWSPDQIVGYLKATSSFISIFGTIKLSVEPFGNTYANPLRKGVKGIIQKTAEVAWQQSVILPKDLQKLSIEKSPAIGKLIPSLAAEPSTVS